MWDVGVDEALFYEFEELYEAIDKADTALYKSRTLVADTPPAGATLSANNGNAQGNAKGSTKGNAKSNGKGNAKGNAKGVDKRNTKCNAKAASTRSGTAPRSVQSNTAAPPLGTAVATASKPAAGSVFGGAFQPEPTFGNLEN